MHPSGPDSATEGDDGHDASAAAEERHAPDGASGAPSGPEDGTLGGYLRVHERPPAFEGSDGQPYTVSIEVEKTPNLMRPFVGYLVFPRWAETGLGIVGHVETGVLWEETSRAEVLERAGQTSLRRVKELLDEAIARRSSGAEGSDVDDGDWPSPGS